MTPDDALSFFGSKAEIARALGVQPPSVSEWFEQGAIPDGRQYQLELATDGKLKADLPALRKTKLAA